MDVPILEMPRNAARKAVVEYRRAVRERHSIEDEAILRCYRMLAAGTRVINISDAMRAGGEHPRYRTDAPTLPWLAIARADMTRVQVDRATNGDLTFDVPGRAWRRRSATRLLIRDVLPRTGLPRAAQTIVPIIPPEFRPAPALSNYHILWEVEEWRITPPRDPMLLKHLGGPLYAVLAVWDLTEVERMVIGMTRG